MSCCVGIFVASSLSPLDQSLLQLKLDSSERKSLLKYCLRSLINEKLIQEEKKNMLINTFALCQPHAVVMNLQGQMRQDSGSFDPLVFISICTLT